MRWSVVQLEYQSPSAIAEGLWVIRGGTVERTGAIALSRWAGDRGSRH